MGNSIKKLALISMFFASLLSISGLNNVEKVEAADSISLVPVKDFTIEGTGMTRTVSSDMKTGTWDFTTVTSDVKLVQSSCQIAEDNGLIFRRGGGDYPRYKKDGYLSSNSNGDVFVPVPSGASGKITVEPHSGSDGRRYGLYINDTVDPEGKVIWSKPAKGSGDEGKRGPQYFEFDSSDLTLNSANSSYYIDLRAVNGEMKSLKIIVELTSGQYEKIMPRAYFNANGGVFANGASSIYVSAQSETDTSFTTAPESPTHPTGYKFLGWSETQGGATYVSTFEYGKTYYACWSSTVEATSININYGTLQMNEGEGKWLDVVTVPSGASAGNLTWSSSDPSIATVDKDGYVEAVAPGTCTITVTNGTLSDTCQIVVVTTTKYTVTFQMEGYEDKQVTVYAGAKVTVPGQFQSMKGYDVQWTYNGEVFDPNVDVVKSDMTLVGKIVPNGHATEIIFQKFDADNNPVDVTANEVINIKNNNKLSFRLSRADGEPITVTEPYAWSSNDITTITVDQSGNLQALKMGRVQITLSLYAETNDNRITATIVVINPEKTDGNGNVIDTNISLIAQKGYFKATGDNERGARFIAVIPEEYLPYIYSAKMTIVATLDSNGDGEYEINQTYEVDIKTFYKTVGYQSKTPSSGELKKDWSEEGKLGAAVTINKIPYYGFSGGTLSATFVVTDKDSRLDIPAYASLSF